MNHKVLKNGTVRIASIGSICLASTFISAFVFPVTTMLAPISITQQGQEDVFSSFLDTAQANWIDQENKFNTYSFNCNLERKFEGVPSQGESTQIQAKRLIAQRLVQLLTEGQPSKVWAMNSDYFFKLESTKSGRWIPSEVTSDPKESSVEESLSLCLIQPDLPHLALAPFNLCLKDIPWDDPDKVQFIKATEIEPLDNRKIVEMEFIFNFDSSINNLTVDIAKAYKKATIRFDTERWNPIYSQIVFDSGQQKIHCTSNIEYSLDRRITTRTDHLKFLGTEIESLITMNNFEWLPSPGSSEFRLPHYGIPEFSRGKTPWVKIILLVATILTALVFLFKFKRKP